MNAAASSIYLTANCYGGWAQAAFMTSLMSFRATCVAKGVRLRLELQGGEALSSRGRATEMAKFLASDTTHLVFAEADRSFEADEVFGLVASGQPVAEGVADSGLLMVRRDAAQAMWDGYPELRGRLGDMSGVPASEASFVFDHFADPDSGLYLDDIAAFCRRWRDLRDR